MSSSSSSNFLQSLSSVGLAYSIAVTVGLLVLIISLLLVSYFCFRNKTPHPNPNSTYNSTHPSLPRVIFVPEEDHDTLAGNGTGLSLAAIRSYPKFEFNRKKMKNENSCTICLAEYREGEMIRKLPDCLHCFHLDCIDEWLRISASCPVCRTSPMPTPLAEVVPLSHYASDRAW